MSWKATTVALFALAACASQPAVPDSHLRNGPSVPTPTNDMPTNADSTSATILAPDASPVSYDRIPAFPPPGMQVPRQVSFSPDGKLVTYLQGEPGGAEMKLFAMAVGGGEHRVLVSASDLVAEDRAMSREEELRRERQRQRIRGITGYQWARRANVMLLPVGGDVFVREGGDDAAVRQLTQHGGAIDPKICADGSRVAFARDRELHVLSVADGRETALTKGAPQGVTRGQSDFNGQEEFDEPSGHWWAPSCDRLAFLEVDETKVDRVPVVGFRDGPDLQHLRYPRAGTTNPTTRLGIVSLDGAVRWVTLPTGGYIGRVRWSHDGNTLYAQHMSRSQRALELYRIDPKSGQATAIITERDDAWLDFSELHPLDDGSFVWLALRDGHRHLDRRDGQTGALVTPLTRGEWDVFGVAGQHDDGTGLAIYFIGNQDAVLDRQLYRVVGDSITRVTKDDGVHEINAERLEHGFIDVWSANGVLPSAQVRSVAGNIIGELPVPHDADLESLKIRPMEMITLTGEVELHGALLKPRNLEPGKRYPVLVQVYGGPGVQKIDNSYDPRLLWQHLADRGVAVFQIDNRGSKGRGHAFETPIHRRLGEVELADQLRAVEYLRSLDFVDPDRIGIYGHSYGGYMAALAMLRAPGTYKVAVSGSPVTDWALYDTGYTERYMETPESNAEGYAATSLLPHAAALTGKLLLIHSMMDENVHYEHTAKLIDALVAADRDFDLLVFPGERHGYRSPAARHYVYRRIVDYFAEHL